MKARTRLSLAFLLFLAVFPASAQMEATVSVFPNNPEPYQEVILTLTSYSFDVNVAKITWKTGNTTILSGFGTKELRIVTGGVGSETAITYLAETPQGDAVTGSITVAPQFVEIMYEAPESYAPPFYEGRTLPSEGARVKVTAMPYMSENRKIVPPSFLSYSWYVNDEFYQTTSGLSGATVSLPLDYLTTATEIKTRIRTPLGNTAEKKIMIYPSQPSPLFYTYDELLGANYSRAHTGRIELSKDITLILEPYYLSARGFLEKSTNYAWFIDGLPVTPQEKNMLTLKPKADSYGTRILSVTVENSKRILQKAKLDAEIIFDTRN